MTFTAVITSPTVTAQGPVTFTVGKTVLGTAQLSSGKAKFTTSGLPGQNSLGYFTVWLAEVRRERPKFYDFLCRK